MDASGTPWCSSVPAGSGSSSSGSSGSSSSSSGGSSGGSSSSSSNSGSGSSSSSDSNSDPVEDEIDDSEDESEAATNDDNIGSASPSRRMSNGGKAGAAVGAILAMAFLVVILIICRRRRWFFWKPTRQDIPPRSHSIQSQHVVVHNEKTTVVDKDFLGQYQYTTLREGEFRLLSLQSIDVECRYVVGTLTTHQIDSAPPYQALSYVWNQKPVSGSGRKEEALELRIRASDSSSSYRTLNVGWNLGEAFKVIVTTVGTSIHQRMVWTDSVCIDQSKESQEKATQIPRMKDIYQQAEKVAAWLGVDDEHLEETLQMIKSYEHDNIDKDIAMALLAKLSRRPFFERVWILQEVVVASEVEILCGRVRVHWDSIGMLCEKVDLHIRHASDFFIMKDVDTENDDHIVLRKRLRLMQVLQTERWRHGHPRLLTLVQKFRDWGCTCPEDRVYANIGIASDEERSVNSVRGYTDEVSNKFVQYPAHSVFARLIIEDAKSIKRLDGLNCHTGLENPTFPSWIPDFHARNESYSLIDVQGLGAGSWFHQQRQLYTASGDSEPDIEVLDPPENIRHLAVVGFTIDFIRQTGDVPKLGKPMDPESTLPATLAWATDTSALFRSWMLDARKRRESYVVKLWGDGIWSTDALIEQGLRRLAVGDRLDGRTGNQKSDLLSIFGSYGDVFADSLINHPPVSWAVHTRRKPFCTDDGLIGVGPASSSAKDHVCVLFGGQTPYVLEELPNGNFKFKGECYVDGIMDGEAYADFRTNQAAGVMLEKRFVLE